VLRQAVAHLPAADAGGADRHRLVAPQGDGRRRLSDARGR
jgi:hypothetical protein